jgi:hypothetical protein
MHQLTRTLTSLLFFFAAAPACAQEKSKVEPTKHPFLWRIEGEPASYLYGTFHVGDPRITTLPASVQKAIEASHVLLTELDFADKAGARAMKDSMLPRGQTLNDVLPADLYARIEEYAKSRRYPMAGLEKMKPWVVGMMLPMLDDMKTMLGGQPLDLKLVTVAKDFDLETGALETYDEQMGAIGSFSDEEHIKMLRAALDMLEQADKEGRKPIQEMIAAYLSGDLAELDRVMNDMAGLEAMADVKAKFEKVMLTDRNHHMAQRLAAKLRAEPKRAYFCAVGAAHYLGDEGVLALLQKDGFKIERVDGPPVDAKKAVEKKEPVGAGK